jgi:hypothetical protein
MGFYVQYPASRGSEIITKFGTQCSHRSKQRGGGGGSGAALTTSDERVGLLFLGQKVGGTLTLYGWEERKIRGQ